MQPAWVDFSKSSIEDYDVIDLLGTGGFARVYRAKYLPYDLEVAIKMIDKKQIKERGLMQRINQEVQVHIQLEHPSVVTLHSYFEDDDYVYLVLELCHKGDLQSYVDQMGRVSEELAAPLFMQVIDGLIYLHSHKIIHRDISLKNILVTHDMHVKIADFGLAVQLDRMDEKHMTMCGTANFMAPEVATGASHGLQVDVWSLGCMLYTLLVGKAPFECGTIKGTLTKVVMEPYTFPPYLSSNAKDLIDRMLQKRAEDRIKLEDISKHPFISSPKTSKIDKYGSLSNSGQDSGLGRTISSIAKTRYRSQSEDRILPSQLPNGFKKKNQVNLNSKPLVGDARRVFPLSEKFARNQRKNEAVLGPMKKVYPLNNMYIQSNANQASVKSEPAVGETANIYQLNDKYSSWCKDGHSAMYGLKARMQNRQLSPPVEETPWHQNGHQPLLRKYPSKDVISEEGKEKIKKKLKEEMVPFDTKRLEPKCFRASNVICSIVEGGDVYVQFIKKKRDIDKVYEVCRITSDGMRIAIYSLPKSREVGSEPPQIPENEASLYSFQNLPSCHYKKYVYAARFVQVVRANTPKITLYTNLAKCLYMENGPNPNCDVYFYDGIEVFQANGKLKLKSVVDGRLYLEDEISERFDDYVEHYKQCYERCVRLETSLTYLENTTGFPYFPAQIGRKPAPLKSPSAKGKENIMLSAYNTPRSVLSSTISQVRSNSENGSQSSNKKTNISGLGVVTQFANGINRIDYDDGSILTIKPDGKFVHLAVNGNIVEYNSVRNLPLNLRDKFEQLSKVLGNILQSNCRNIR